MTALIRHRALGLLVGAAVLLAAAGPARAAGRADARISSTYVMHGRILTAVRVRGEHRGQSITRRWTFTGLECASSVCRQLRLRRQRSAHRVDQLTLSRVGVGSYAGRGRFSSGLRCRGRRYPHGLVVPYTIRVQVSRVVRVEGIGFAGRLSAVYTNRRRLDHTPCPLGPSHDAARYTGVAAPLPSPPAPAFLVAAHPADDSATFTDTSVPGAGDAPIVARLWQFGDPASGAADSATVTPAGHTFSAPGDYQVTLTVTDANGLSATTTRLLTAPGPPTAGFTAARAGTSPTFAFRDASQPGIGGAAVVAWYWGFGDSHSSANTSRLQNPQHTFSAPGTYQVCLIVIDANGRGAGHCGPIVIAARATASAGRGEQPAVRPRSQPSPARR